MDAASLVSAAHFAQLVALVETGALTDRLARQDLEGVVAGEGSPADVVTARNLAVVTDDTALIAAIDLALADQPDVREKIRDGKVQAVGAVIGAVMKAMAGAAGAARVRNLILERAQQKLDGRADPEREHAAVRNCGSSSCDRLRPQPDFFELAYVASMENARLRVNCPSKNGPVADDSVNRFLEQQGRSGQDNSALQYGISPV